MTKTNELKMAKPAYLVSDEDEEQKAVINWCQYNLGRWPELEYIFHVPNGEKREPWVGRKLELMGVKRGVPDLMLLVPRGGFHGLLLEMKRIDKNMSDLSKDQRRFLAFENVQGFATCVGFGSEDAIKKITAYMEGRLK